MGTMKHKLAITVADASSCLRCTCGDISGHIRPSLCPLVRIPCGFFSRTRHKDALAGFACLHAVRLNLLVELGATGNAGSR